jgi:hypothetical protein
LKKSHLASSGHVDWDSVEAVERAAAVVQERLEATLQASVIGNKPGETFGEFPSSKDKKDVTTPSSPPTRFIRKVSVVVGRGFYTYCPGPAAPFLRVEYYDPKVRWKVKATLERGLELPHMYHPDPQQYDAVAMAPAADSSQLGLDPLSFHCYEAHIPYTMQFFKDWNLAGKSNAQFFSLLTARNLLPFSHAQGFFCLSRHVLYSSHEGKISAAITVKCHEAVGQSGRRHLWQ